MNRFEIFDENDTLVHIGAVKRTNTSVKGNRSSSDWMMTEPFKPKSYVRIKRFQAVDDDGQIFGLNLGKSFDCLIELMDGDTFQQVLNLTLDMRGSVGRMVKQ